VKLRWLTVGVPLALSLGIIALMINGQLTDPVFRLRLSEATLVVVVGILLSALLAVNFAAQERLIRIHRESMARAREETAEEHRRFLNRLDHELKNPLMAIRAGLANLSSTTDELASQQITTSIDAQAVRLSHLVADLRKVADIGTRPLERDPIQATELVREAFSTVQDDPLTRQRRLTLNLRPDNDLIAGDRDLLVLALHNLIDNALKFTRPDDQIEVRAFKAGDTFVFEVADSGLGIPDTEISQVWKELYRGPAAHGVPGNGIGLALVQAIVERHGGQVDLRSTPGQGTTVGIRLPIYRQNNTASNVLR
jgi:two-component system, OmpR family, sensor kinase